MQSNTATNLKLFQVICLSGGATDYLFRDYIGELFNMKLNSQKGTPMYLISKLLMNSLYGKFGIHFELPNYTVIEYDE